MALKKTLSSRSRDEKPLILAGIDIGTNTIRLLIAEFQPGGRYRRLKTERFITRLGEDLTRTGRLKDEAIKRTIDVLTHFAKLCNSYSVDSSYVVATSAVREAYNGRHFVQMVKEKTGFDVEIISGEEEARLITLGVFDALGLKNENAFIMDIGGGSTEFISTSGERILFKTSTDIGVVRFTEQFIKTDPPGRRDIIFLESAIEERLRSLWIEPKDVRGFLFIGTAGTITTLAAIDQQMEVYDPEKITGYKMDIKNIERIRHKLVSMSTSERRRIKGIEKGREDIIVAGVIIVDMVMKHFGFSEMIVSDSGLREGLVIDLYEHLRQEW